MNRRKFVQSILGVLAAVPFLGLVFKERWPHSHLTAKDLDTGETLSAIEFDRLVDNMKFECKDFYINGEKYRAVNIIDDVVVERIEDWCKMHNKTFVVGGPGLLK